MGRNLGPAHAFFSDKNFSPDHPWNDESHEMMNPIKISKMSTENNYVDLHKPEVPFLSFSLMRIWRVIYFLHYIIMNTMSLNLFKFGCCIQHPYSLLYRWFTHCTQHTCGRSRGSEPSEWITQPSNSHFLHRDEIDVMTKMSTIPCRYTRYFSFANSLIVKLFFLKLIIFPVFGIIFIFQAFVFWGSIPVGCYGKIIPLYLNRVVRLTPLHIITIAKIDNWTLGKSSRMQSWPTSACVKSCFAKWRLKNASTI